ncbi:hypothetical protein TNCV_4989321 [Trichonephila clavipes]|uniref:Uncharacterized protein n=1 Tax=Trichonephila clavipes TaxID=2585209 RepID=A0A8X6WAF5_TRICX|nr:hypothetical protein TNCV_4989321 [Trichonephila clavipes]
MLENAQIQQPERTVPTFQRGQKNLRSFPGISVACKARIPNKIEDSCPLDEDDLIEFMADYDNEEVKG